MKKRMILAASFLAAVALTSCNNNDFEEDVPAGSAQLVEIKVGQKVQGIETKAAISTGSTVEATIIATDGAAFTDWADFKPVEKNTYVDGTTDWDVNTFANVSIGTFEAGTAKSVALNPALYASKKGATLTGVAPAGKVVSGKVTFAVMDGQQDVMIAPTTPLNAVVMGQMESFSLAFTHKTAQLRFILSAVGNDGKSAWKSAKPLPDGDVITVKSVTVNKAKLPTAVNLNTPMSVTWGSASDIALNDLTSVIPVTYGKQPGHDTPGAEKADTVLVEKVALVKPDEAVWLSVKIAINGKENTYNNIKPMTAAGNQLTTAEAKFHNIRLTIKQPAAVEGIPAIIATATVTDWVAGDEGTANL